MNKNLIILSKEKLESIILQIKDKNNKKSYLSTISTFAISFIIAATTTKSFNEINLLGLSSRSVGFTINVLATLGVLATIIEIFRYLVYKKRGFNFNVNYDNIITSIEDASEYKENKTLILLFPRKDNKVLKFPVQRKASWRNSYFFPYINDTYSQDISDDKENIKNAIKKKYNISTDIFIDHLYNMDFSAPKFTANNFPKMFHYRFILVYPISSFFKKKVLEELRHENFEFLELKKMLEDKTTKIHNEDVIERLQDYIHEITKKHDISLKRRSKIIWNIDKSCKQSCIFCAYGDQESIKEKISLDDKLELVDSFSSLHVDNLDIATGDNPNVSDLKTIINYCKTKLDISMNLTTTAEVLKLLGINFIKEHIDNVEITYDSPQTKVNEFRSASYNKNNYEIAKELIKEGINVEALVILYTHLDARSLKAVQNDLSKLGVRKILLIRLMPVGKQSINDYPKELLNKGTYTKMGIKRIIKLSKTSLHCSLQGLTENDKITPCEMGKNKLGISATGDVYACPWAEHLTHHPNPFYLGNLIKESDNLFNFLSENEVFTDLLQNNNINQPHCKIFSYLKSNDIFASADSLYL